MLIYLASLLVSTAELAPPAPRPIAQLVHTRWTAKDGAPNAIHALAQTPDGYLWIGSSAGVIRFDGVRFVPFTPRGGDTLPSVMAVQRMLVTRDGSLWVIWRLGGISRLRNGIVSTYGERDGLSVAFQLAESSDGMLVAGTVKGLARFTNGKWEDVTAAWNYPGKESRAVWFDRDDVLWAQTQDRIVYRPKGSNAFLDPGMPLKSWPFRADFAQASDGTIWMSELNRSAHTLRRVGEDSASSSEVMVYPAALLIDRQGSLWVGAAGGGLRRVIDPTLIRGKKVGTFGPEAERFHHAGWPALG
jgi:ligand-binding sensor domain-containing protein